MYNTTQVNTLFAPGVSDVNTAAFALAHRLAIHRGTAITQELLDEAAEATARLHQQLYG